MNTRLHTSKTKLYTVVHDGYEVTVYRTLKSVSESLAAEKMSLEKKCFNGPETKVASALDIAAALRKNSSACLFPPSGGDWLYKVEKQTRIF